jgi:hypothetical protein
MSLRGRSGQELWWIKPAAEEITGKGLAGGRPSEADMNMDELDMN